MLGLALTHSQRESSQSDTGPLRVMGHLSGGDEVSLPPPMFIRKLS